MHWGRKWNPTPVFLPGESQTLGSLVGCCRWGRTESDTTERLSSSSEKRLDAVSVGGGRTAGSFQLWSHLPHTCVPEGASRCRHTVRFSMIPFSDQVQKVFTTPEVLKR